MATWDSFCQYVRKNYKVASEADGLLNLQFETPNGRHQMVLLSHNQTLPANDWVTIASPIGEVSKIELPLLLKLLENIVCGGVATSGDFVLFQHSVLLPDLAVNEFEVPLSLVVNTADALESIVSKGADNF